LSSDYYMYKFVWYGIQPVSDARFEMQTSSDNGVSFDSGASDYDYIAHQVTMATSPAHTVVGNDNATRIQFVEDAGNLANELIDLEITLFSPLRTEYTQIKFEGTSLDDTIVGTHIIGGGVRLEAAAVNGVRFFFNTGNIATGTLKVYGVRA